MGLVRGRPLLSFYVLAYAITWAVVLPLMLSRRGIVDWELPHELEFIGAFGPFIAAMLVARACFGRVGPARILTSLTNLRAPAFWWAFALFSPFVLLLAGYVALWAIGGAMPATDGNGIAELLTIAGLVDLIVISGILQAWGEEPGWRGFAIPLLRSRFGSLAATLCLFPVWLFWHLPFFLSRPEFGWPQFIGFSVGILSAAVWLTLIYDATGNLLLAVVWHAVVNIARGIALAVSVPLFLSMGNGVLLGAVIIMIYWLMKRPGPTLSAGFDLGK